MKKLDYYKTQLLNAGFSEAKYKAYSFYRADTEKTAFIVNLTETEKGTEVLYGFCSTAHMMGEEEHFANWGTDKDSCNFRHYVTIDSNNDESEVKELIRDLYIQYHNTEKDELLNIVKERRKVFLNRFAALLKPIGFRKKGNKWTKKIADNYILTFNAQKSDFSDQYYFNIFIDKEGTNSYVGCYYTRIATNSECIYNWQLMSDAEIQALLIAIEQEINTILNTPIEILGKQKWIWENCNCRRNCCDICWVEKNRWEAKELEN